MRRRGERRQGGLLGAFEEIADRRYSDTPELSEPRKVFVAGNDHVSQTADRAFKHTVIVRIFNDGFNHFCWRGNLGVTHNPLTRHP